MCQGPGGSFKVGVNDLSLREYLQTGASVFRIQDSDSQAANASDGLHLSKEVHMRHTATFQLPERVLGSSDIVIKVKADGKKFGELRVSMGAIVWLPGRKGNGHKMTWGKLDAAMVKCPSVERPKKT